VIHFVSCRLYNESRFAYTSDVIPGRVFKKLFRIGIKIRLNLNILLLWIVFRTYHSYLTIDCLYLIKYIVQTRILGILSFFMKETVNLIVETVMEIELIK